MDEIKLKENLNHVESLYWVFTHLCNDQCSHCYNSSGPQGGKLSMEDIDAIIDNLPDEIDRLILSGGEPLAEKKKLYHILDRIYKRYSQTTQVMVQTNGDLLTEEILDKLLEKNVTRIDIASIDRYHKFQGQRAQQLIDLFESRGMSGDEQEALVRSDNYVKPVVSYGFWGATEDLWLGGNWAKGRALETGVWSKKPDHNFCTILSGGRNYLGGYSDIPQEFSIQLWKVNPCCPGTKLPLGDARKEKVADIISRSKKFKAMRNINMGNPWKMGEQFGISEKEAKKRTQELGNICLFCDEVFDKHFDYKNDQLAERE